MKTFVKRAKYIVAVGMTSLVATSSLWALVPSHAAAATSTGPSGNPSGTFDSLPIDQQAAIWSSMEAALSHNTGNGCGLAVGSSESAIADGKWFGGGANVGAQVAPDTGGTLDCQNQNSWFSNLMNAAGYAGNYITPARSVFNYSNSDYYPKSDSISILRSVLTANLFGGSAPRSAPDYLTGYILMTNFTAASECNAKPVLSPNDLAGVASNQVATIPVYDYNSNTIKQVQYKFDKPTDYMSVGYGLPVAGSGDGQITCDHIAQELGNAKYASAIQSYIKAHPNAVPASTTATSGDACPIDGTSSLGWIICPLLEMGIGAAHFLQNTIQSFLYTPSDQIFNNKNFQATAAVFRNFGIALIIIVGLFMIVSQALGMEFVDAYTIRKVLPRLMVAIIGMALAWPILHFFVTFFNDLGVWTNDIIQSTVKLPASTLPPNPSSLAVSLMGIVGGMGLVAVGLLTMGGAGLLSLLFTMVLAGLVGLLVLTIRQMVIIMTIILAPLAIACYVLPGTQKVWKFWKDAFITTLAMFPIIMAFIASGRALAYLLGGPGNSTALHILAAIAYFAPYFMLPFAFKLAGGLMSTVLSIANDRGRGGFDRLKKFRKERTAANFHDMKNGNRFKSENWAANKFNRTTENVAGVRHAGYNPAKWKSRMHSGMSTHSMAEAAEFAEKNGAMKAIIGNDDYLMAGIHGKGDDAKVKSYLLRKGYQDGVGLDQAVASIRSARRAASPEVFDIAAAMALPATGTAFRSGAGEMNELINEVAGNDDVKAGRMLAAMRSGAGQARRFDISGGSFGEHLKIMARQRLPVSDPQHLTADQASRMIFEQALEGQGGAYVVGARNSAVKNFAPVMVNKLSTAATSGNSRAIEQELAVLAGRYDAMASQAPENARVMADNVLSQQITINGTTQTIQQHIEDHRSEPEFVQMRREYARMSGNQAAYLAGQQQPPGPGGPPPGMPTPPGQ